MIKTAVLQASGYTGLALVELLLRHPEVQITALTSRSQAGLTLDQVEPRLAGRSTLRFIAPDALDVAALDCVFVCAEHGQAALLVEALLERGYQGAVIDLSADFRLRNALDYPRWYGAAHPAPGRLEQFVYGLADALPNTERTRYVANPGCFASGINLTLLPLARLNLLEHASINAITGATGSGIKPSEATHFPRREGNLRAYKVFAHQHLAEIKQCLGESLELDFVPISGPFSRGIWGTLSVSLCRAVEQAELDQIYRDFYQGRRLLRLHPATLPELRFAVSTPFIDIGLLARGRRALLGFALDNLLKGAASQALQNFNRLFNFDDAKGLL